MPWGTPGLSECICIKPPHPPHHLKPPTFSRLISRIAGVVSYLSNKVVDTGSFLVYIGTMSKEIELSRGQVALVDDADYEVLSGVRWYASRGRFNKTYYACRRGMVYQGRRLHVMMHRLIVGAPTGMVVDHINHDGLDNRRENLRVVTQRQNLLNRSFAGRGYVGVFWYAPAMKWGASYCHRHVGYFDSEVEAAIAYNAFAYEMDGRDAPQNKIVGLNAIEARRHIFRPRVQASKYRGINFSRQHGKWFGKVQVNGKRHRVGFYDTEREAVLAYNEFCEIVGMGEKVHALS